MAINDHEICHQNNVYSDDQPDLELANPDTLSSEQKELKHQRMLLRTVRQESLVDMQNDPGETRNLAKDPTYAGVLKTHRAYLEEFARQYGDEFSAPAASE